MKNISKHRNSLNGFFTLRVQLVSKKLKVILYQVRLIYKKDTKIKY